MARKQQTKPPHAGYRSAPVKQTMRRFPSSVFLQFRFSQFKNAARAVGLTPRQHQALLAIKGFPVGHVVTVGDLAERLRIRHHSAVELVDHLRLLLEV
jgi:O6-methylguanine-DNA--protein-cysteine methyltransferase